MEFNRDRFAEVVGSTFSFKEPDGQSVDLELIEVTEAKERPNQISFVTVFLGPESKVIEQGLYDLEHETMGEMQLMLVPVGITNGRLNLEAVFNSLKA